MADCGDLCAPAQSVTMSQILSGLSFALDLTEGQRPGHSVRSCLIGMRIGDALGVPAADRTALYYALLMKDLGCSSNAARFAALFGSSDHDLKLDIKTVDWTHALDAFRFMARQTAPGAFWPRRVWRMLALVSHGAEGVRAMVRTRCERGAEIAGTLQLPAASADAIRALDEHWNGGGQPYGIRGTDIPLLARILNVAQTFEVFFTTHGLQAARDMAASRRGTWFDPTVVDALFATPPDSPFWTTIRADDALQQVRALAPPDPVLSSDDEQIDRVAESFASVIDAKSPWTYRHSRGVADLAVRIGAMLGYSEAELRMLRRAGLLHDIGKLGVSNLILDKPDRLTEAEFAVMRQHPHHTAAILRRTGCFAALADEAAAHHERLDGRGYHRGLQPTSIPLSARILGVADVFDALRMSRPYREGLPVERTLEIMARDAGIGTDPECVAALRTVLDQWNQPVDHIPAARRVAALDEDYQQAA